MHRSLLHLSFLIGLGVLVAVFAFAMWKGDRAERYGAAFNLAAGLLAVPPQYLLAPDIQPLALLAIDGALAAGFLMLALRYASLWLGAALLLQAVQFSMHAYYLLMTARPDYTYMAVNNVDTTGINICIVAGILLAWRSRVRAVQPTT